jgi:hypothetical protein
VDEELWPGDEEPSPPRHPVRLVIAGDLERRRVSVLFRIVLLVPHILLAAVWTAVVYGRIDQQKVEEGAVVVLVSWGTLLLAWVVTLASKRLWDELHAFHARFLRWNTHVLAYAALLAEPYPRFDGRPGYAVDLEVEPPAEQERWKVALRLILAIPALIFSFVLTVVLLVVAVAGWFAALATGRMPRGLHDLGAYCLRFSQQTAAYLLLLTDRYPTLASAEVRREDAT